MPLRRNSWAKLTAQVPPGQRRRVEHDCGDGKVLLISNNMEGYSAWCFRCNEAGFIPHHTPSLSERLALMERTRIAEVRASSTVAPPDPRQTDPQQWPLHARVWLYKAGLSNDDIERISAYYHPPTQRVILPVMRDGECIYWQGRDTQWVRGSGRIKYINPAVDKTHLCAKYGSGPVIVLTEDILSGYRVARVTEAWALMGTELAPGVLADLVKQNKPVVVMTDPDAGGQKAGAKITRTLGALGLLSFVASPTRDPKYLTVEETKSCVNSCLPSQLCLQ